MDWRIIWILIIVAVAIVATSIVYYYGYGHDPQTFFGAIYAAWVGGLALFAITGIFVAIVSLAKPENEGFDARARILFRRETGKHIDYIVSKIKEEFEHYCETTTLRISIREYDATDKKFRVSSNNEATVRSYLDDVETTYNTTLKIEGATLPPANGASNRLVYTRVAGHQIGSAELFTDSISRPIACRVDRDGTCEVCTMVEFWVLAVDEPNTHLTRRYTQHLSLEFENLVASTQEVEIKLTTDGTHWITERLAVGQSKQVAEFKDVKPGIQLFEYRLLAP